MRFPMRVLLAALAAAFLASAGQAGAETREIDADALILTHGSGSDLTLNTDPALHHRLRVTMQGDAGCLTVTTAGAAILGTANCVDVHGGLHIDTPPDMPVTITQNGDGHIILGNLAAPLVVSATGSGDIRAGNIGPLVLSLRGSADVSLGDIRGPAHLDMTGNGDVRVRSIAGPLTVQHNGSGDVAVGRIDSQSVAVNSTGPGDILLGSGQVGTLQVRIAGDGDFALAGEAHDADVSAVGGGDIKLGKVSGTLHRLAEGGSDIYVGGPALVDATIGRIAKAIANDESPESHGVQVSHTGGHVLTVIVLAVGAFMVWRIARRGGLRRPSASMPGQAVTGHPGVTAVTETLQRVEARLGRVENYVTSREFDLQQKFKKL